MFVSVMMMMMMMIMMMMMRLHYMKLRDYMGQHTSTFIRASVCGM